MTKITITKKMGGIEALNLLSAFKVETNTYLVLDSERTGSMGLPIIYVTKYTDHLEKIIDDNEWQSVKNYLKGIINGTNFEYVNVPTSITADEAYYKELSLPNLDSFNAIKDRYKPAESTPAETLSALPEAPTSVPVTPEVTPNVAPTEPLMPSAPATATVVTTPPQETVAPAPAFKEEAPAPVNNPTSPDFSTDKETFLKACENMFDALISKYQKELKALDEREKALTAKEQEIEAKMQNASEHLANAEAREQVANIAHDNAQKVMDLTSMMPTNPDIQNS